MARSMKNPGYPSYLPRNWRVMTVAGVTTLGLACGLGKPALAEWWKLSQADKATPAAANAKPIPAENGFTATIRRLQADSRRAAEQGDYAKAIQLAERAAKISEASAQLLGPTSECSPQETTRFLAEMRSKRDGLNTVAARSPASPKVSQLPVAPVASSQPVAKDPKPAVKTPAPVRPAPTVSVAETATGPQLFGAGEVPRSPSGPIAQRRPAVIQPKQMRGETGTVPPSPAGESAESESLLTQSRRAAANGKLDQAIELAEQAMELSRRTSLFGPGTSRASNDAQRWLDHLLAQQTAQAQDEQVFQPPVKVADNREQPTLPDTEPVTATPETNDINTPVATSVASSDAVWSEDLPPAPAPQPKNPNEPARYSRSEIRRSGGWVDADALESQEAAESRASVDPGTGNEAEESAQTPTAIPEFPIANFTEPAVPQSDSVAAVEATESHESAAPIVNPTVEPSEAARQDDVTQAVESTTIETVPVTSAVPHTGRVPLRVRGNIQQVAAEVPNSANEARLPQSNFDWATNADESTETADSVEGPVQRFPIQKVIQLRRRLESAAALNPGASSSDKVQAPVTDQAPPETSPQKPLKLRRESVPVQMDLPKSSVPVAQQPSEPATRPGVKLRTRTRLKVDDALEAVSHASTEIPKMPSPVRKPVVAQSEATRWKTVESPPTRTVTQSSTEVNTGSKQPALAAPISQAAFETTTAEKPSVNAGLVAPGMNVGAVADEMIGAPPPPSVPEETPWYHDEARKARRSAGSSAVVHKSSFGMIDKLAESFRVPVATMMSLIGFGGLALVGLGLIAVRTAMRRRHLS